MKHMQQTINALKKRFTLACYARLKNQTPYVCLILTPFLNAWISERVRWKRISAGMLRQSFFETVSKYVRWQSAKSWSFF